MKKLFVLLLVVAVLVLGWKELTRDGKSPLSFLDGTGPTDPETSTSGDDVVDTSPYPSPNLEHQMFNVDELTLPTEQRAELVSALNSLATQKATPSRMKSMALALSLRLDPANVNASGANSMLKRGLVPDPSTTGGKVEPKASADELFRLATALLDAPHAGKSNRLLAAYVLDIARAILPRNKEFLKEFNGLSSSGTKIDWIPVVGEPNQPKPPRVKSAVADHIGPKGSNGELLRLQTLVKGLLVRELEGSQYAGSASQMNATAVRVELGHEMDVTFNQEVGADMDSALREVVKFHRLRHGALPANYQVEIAFEEQYIPKDGPSAAVACALLLESLIADIDFDPRFAVTGDLNADGSVQRVGGITGKMRGAQHRDCNVFGLPEGNSRVLSDLLLMDGPTSLADIQAFSLTTFEDALALARMHEERPEDLQRSIDMFAEVQGVLKTQGMTMLKNSHVQERLRECVRLAPNHLSARNLFLAATGQSETQLSLQGSLEYIDRAAAPLLRVMRQGDFQERTGLDGVSGDEFAETASAIRRIRAVIDPRARTISDAIVDYAQEMRTFVNNRPRSRNGLNALIGKINQAGHAVAIAYDELESSVGYQEEVMK